MLSPTFDLRRRGRAPPASAAARGPEGPALRVIIADGTFHGVIAANAPIGSFITRMLRLLAFRGMVTAVIARCLFDEPADEAGGVGDLVPDCGQWLVRFRGCDHRQVFRVRQDQVGKLAQDRGGSRRRPSPALRQSPPAAGGRHEPEHGTASALCPGGESLLAAAADCSYILRRRDGIRVGRGQAPAQSREARS